MPYKITGNISEDARILVIDESGPTIENNTTVSGSSYEVTGLESGTKTVIARAISGEALGYSQVVPVYYNPTLGQLSDGTDYDGWTLDTFYWEFGAWWWTTDAQTGSGTSESFIMTGDTKYFMYHKRANLNASAVVQIKRVSDDAVLYSSNANWHDNADHTLTDDVSSIAAAGEEVYIYFYNAKSGSYGQMGVREFAFWDEGYTQLQSPFT
jgi:hypothetical protein